MWGGLIGGSDWQQSRHDYLAHSHRSDNGEAGQQPANQASPVRKLAEIDDGREQNRGYGQVRAHVTMGYRLMVGRLILDQFLRFE